MSPKNSRTSGFFAGSLTIGLLMALISFVDLAKAYDDHSELIRAAANGRVEAVRYLSNSGEPVDARD